MYDSALRTQIINHINLRQNTLSTSYSKRMSISDTIKIYRKYTCNIHINKMHGDNIQIFGNNIYF